MALPPILLRPLGAELSGWHGIRRIAGMEACGHQSPFSELLAVGRDVGEERLSATTTVYSRAIQGPICDG